MTPPQLPDAELAAAIAATALRTSVVSCVPITGYGSVNRIFAVRTAAEQFIVRMRSDAAAPAEYRKERWCLRQAARHGIPGPQVLAVGRRGAIGYMLQTYLAGINGSTPGSDAATIWGALGDYARRIHAIPVTGFGEDLADGRRGRFTAPLHDGFDGTWPGFVRYNLARLRADDPLRALGVLTAARSDTVRERFAALLGLEPRLGLIHGDLAARNTVVAGGCAIALLDWGSAAVHLVPHWDFVQLRYSQISTGAPTAVEMAAFVAGYGLTQTEWAALQPLLTTLLLLRAIDTLRWAIDRQPKDIPVYAEQARRALAQLDTRD